MPTMYEHPFLQCLQQQKSVVHKMTSENWFALNTNACDTELTGRQPLPTPGHVVGQGSDMHLPTACAIFIVGCSHTMPPRAFKKTVAPFSSP